MALGFQASFNIMVWHLAALGHQNPAHFACSHSGWSSRFAAFLCMNLDPSTNPETPKTQDVQISESRKPAESRSLLTN